MLTLGLTGTIHLAVEPVDGRKGIDGLAGVVRGALGHDPACGDLDPSGRDVTSPDVNTD